MAGNEGEKFRVYKKYRFLSSTDGGAIQVVVLNNSIGILTLLDGRGGGRESCRFVENHCLFGLFTASAVPLRVRVGPVCMAIRRVRLSVSMVQRKSDRGPSIDRSDELLASCYLVVDWVMFLDIFLV